MIDLFCYAILSDKLIDLTDWCKPIPVIAPAFAQEKPPSNLPTKIEALKFNSDGFFVGTIRNVSDRTLRGVQLYYEAVDASGNLLDAGSFYALPQDIPPGQVSTFKWFTNKDADTVRIIKTTWEE